MPTGPDPSSLLPQGTQVNRREFVLSVLSVAPAQPAHAAPEVHAGGVPLSFVVNGQQRALTVDPRTSALDLLRERLALTGAKKGCDHG